MQRTSGQWTSWFISSELCRTNPVTKETKLIKKCYRSPVGLYSIYLKWEEAEWYIECIYFNEKARAWYWDHGDLKTEVWTNNLTLFSKLMHNAKERGLGWKNSMVGKILLKLFLPMWSVIVNPKHFCIFYACASSYPRYVAYTHFCLISYFKWPSVTCNLNFKDYYS